MIPTNPREKAEALFKELQDIYQQLKELHAYEEHRYEQVEGDVDAEAEAEGRCYYMRRAASYTADAFNEVEEYTKMLQS